MIYLCLDTNTWINISNGTEPPKLIDRLYEEMLDGDLTIVVPAIVLFEWKKNKQRTIVERTKQSTKEQIYKLKNLNGFLEKTNDELFGFLFEDVNQEEKEDEQLKTARETIVPLIASLENSIDALTKRAETNMNLVDKIFGHKSTLHIETDSLSALEVTKRASKKEFPFEDKPTKKNIISTDKSPKNNFGDCLIFLQFANFAKDNNLSKTHFVSSDQGYFSNKNLHPYYESIRSSANLIFHKSLAGAMNDVLEEEFITQKDLKIIELNQRRIADQEKNYDFCASCGNTFLLRQILKVEREDADDQIDKNQTSLFKNLSLDYNKLLEHSHQEVTGKGFCGTCGLEHFQCPDCNAVWDESDYSVDSKEICLSCGSYFMLHSSQRDGLSEIDKVVILKSIMECKKCGADFENNETSIEICENCWGDM